MLNRDNEKTELTPNQQNPGAAKPEDFTVGEAYPPANPWRRQLWRHSHGANAATQKAGRE
jgi:hypothetical protein